MLTRLLFLAGLILVNALFLMSAWPASIAVSARPADFPLAFKSPPSEPEVTKPSGDAIALLDNAISALSPARIPWLKVKIRQTMTAADSNFVADGFLQCGPNHCVRLVMGIATGPQPSRLVVVSDGEVIVQARQISHQKPITVIERLPAQGGADKEKFLAAKGCGGPHALLKQIQQQIKNAHVKTGLLGENKVISVTGDLDLPPGGRAAVASSVRSCIVQLDAKTLWPHRLEWHGPDLAGDSRMILRMEFLEPELHRRLSEQECIRIFSYTPNQDPGE